MKLFKLFICISLLILVASCGRKGERELYPGYPKSYPVNSKYPK